MILLYMFAPYMVYMLVLIILTSLTLSDLLEDSYYHFNIVLVIIALLFWAYLAGVELKQTMKDGLKYHFSDYWNYIDLLSICISGCFLFSVLN